MPGEASTHFLALIRIIPGSRCPVTGDSKSFLRGYDVACVNERKSICHGLKVIMST